MAVKTVDYKQQLVESTQRGPSESIWSFEGPNAGPEEFIQDPSLGLHFFDDFDVAPNFPGGSFTGSAGRYAIFSTANGAFADDGIVGGGLRLKASTTAQQGLTLGSSAGAYQLITSAGAFQGKLAFECRVAVSTGSFAVSTQDTFIGLCDNLPPASQVPITNTAGTLAASTNFIGFHKRGGATGAADWNFVFGASGQTIQYPTNLTTLVTTVKAAPTVLTYYKLGFVFDPSFAIGPQKVVTAASTQSTAGNLATPMLRIYVNGLLHTTFLVKGDITAATFPSGIMGPVVSFMQQSTTAGIYSAVDWLRVAQTLVA